MDRCPNCRARTDAAPSCRRCGMDLALLQRVEQAADAALHQAVSRFAAGDMNSAGSAARRALALRRTPLAEQLAGFAARRDLPPAPPGLDGARTPTDPAIPLFPRLRDRGI